MLKKAFKQKNIFGRKLGGIVSTVTGSAFPLSFITFFTTLSLFYDKFLSEYISIVWGMAIIACGFVTWLYIYFIFIYPSLIAFAGNQAYAHDSPVKADFDKLNKKLDAVLEEMARLKNE